MKFDLGGLSLTALLTLSLRLINRPLNFQWFLKLLIYTYPRYLRRVKNYEDGFPSWIFLNWFKNERWKKLLHGSLQPQLENCSQEMHWKFDIFWQEINMAAARFFLRADESKSLSNRMFRLYFSKSFYLYLIK